jgi:hypothetical protein
MDTIGLNMGVADSEYEFRRIFSEKTYSMGFHNYCSSLR